MMPTDRQATPNSSQGFGGSWNNTMPATAAIATCEALTDVGMDDRGPLEAVDQARKPMRLKMPAAAIRASCSQGVRQSDGFPAARRSAAPG